MTTRIGSLLGARYRLDAQIGAGGMSTVYRAFDTVLERQVAIKVMHHEIAEDSDQLERFRREARAVARLNHPHVVGVIDAGQEGAEADGTGAPGTPFIVFEYVEGETLKDRIRRRGRLSIPEALAYALEIARALSAAHDAHIVHRDVKPQNVLIDEEGSAKVTDFGIARSLDQEGLTADGRVLGTTDYVSPEQALGHQVTGQSDLYSLGIVLFEMLTGDVPFQGPNPVAVAMKHVREELPDVAIQRPEVSASLATTVDRATAKRLEDRYPDARSLIADLEELLAIETARSGRATGQVTTMLRTLPGEKRRRLPLRARGSARSWAATAVVAAVVVVAVALLAAGRTERGTGKRAVAAPAAGLREVPLSQKGAVAYDPLGGDGEHDGQAVAVVDGVRQSTWSTEGYSSGELRKSGVGIAVDASPGVAARQLEIQTPTPGFTAEVYASPDGIPDDFPGTWTRVAGPTEVAGRQRIGLQTANRDYSRYLVWITDLPPGQSRAAIAEIVLFG